uniref:Small ribosomal subunit protein bS18m n=1 Tax=Chrysemys picta bellii TaxID=8478 RepID=A0A8C3FND0_CHRPI
MEKLLMQATHFSPWKMHNFQFRQEIVFCCCCCLEAVFLKRFNSRFYFVLATVLWRRGYSSQQELVAHKVDLPVEMENPYKDPPKRCVLCGINVDYKNVQLLSQFVSPYTGRIYGRHITGLCGKKQKEISKAIKRAHVIGKHSCKLVFVDKIIFYLNTYQY